MNVYLISGKPGAILEGQYAGTLRKAAGVIKSHLKVQPQDRPDMRVELVELATDKANILRLANGEGGYQGPPIRTWRVGPRGGLVECENEE